ncbi:MAG: hypothetical protein ACTSX4_09620 [Candidatus Helarchaeota archaeon]
MAWEDSSLTEFVHRKSRERNGKLEFIEIRKVARNDEIVAMKIVIGDDKDKKELELSISEWKSILIFFNTIKTKITPTARSITLPSPVYTTFESTSSTKEVVPEEIQLPKEEKVEEPELSISDIVDSIDKKTELQQEATAVEQLEEKISAVIERKQDSEAKIIAARQDLGEKLKVAERNAKELVKSLESAEKEGIKDTEQEVIIDLKPFLKESEREVQVEPQIEVLKNDRVIKGDLAKSIQILGFHETNSSEKVEKQTPVVKLELPTLKAIPKPPALQKVEVKDAPKESSIDFKSINEIAELFPDLKEAGSGAIEGKIADIDLKGKKIDEISNEIVKKAISLQNEIDMNDEEKAKRIEEAMQEVSLLMPDGPARDFVNYMLEKRRKVTKDTEDELPAIPKVTVESVATTIKPKDTLEILEETEVIDEKIPEPLIKKEPELIVEDVPTIWELMEEKEKIDQENEIIKESKTQKLPFTIAVSSEVETEKPKIKEKKLRFW